MSNRSWMIAGVWVAIIGVVVAVIAILVQHRDATNVSGPVGSETTSVSTLPLPTATSSMTAGTSLPPTPPPTTPNVTVTAEIEAGARIGPNEAGSCDDYGYCFILYPHVLTVDGELSEGCYLRWALYRIGAKTPFGQGRQAICGEGIVIGRQSDAGVPPGNYRLDMTIETDAGLTGKGAYLFKVGLQN